MLTTFNVIDNIFNAICSATESIFGWSGDDKCIRDWNRLIEPKLEKFLKGEHITPDGKYVVQRGGKKLHLSADRPMAASAAGAYNQTHESGMIFQDGVKRHILTAPYQSWFRFSFGEFWERRHLDAEYEKRYEEVKKELIEKKFLKRTSPQYEQEEAFKMNGYGDEWRNWERFVFFGDKGKTSVVCV